MKTRHAATLCVALSILPAAANAQISVTQPTAVVAVERMKSVQPGATLPSNSEIILSFNQEISSKKIKQGDTFALSVARDVMVGDYIVIPRGTPASGRIGYRTGKGAFGKSAKMEFDLTDVDLNGRHIPLTGHYRIEGAGNTGATVGAAVAVGVFAVFVTGRSAGVSQGAEYKAFTREAVPITLAANPATVQPAVQTTAQAAGVVLTSASAPVGTALTGH